jgi:hypothetical protein
MKGEKDFLEEIERRLEENRRLAAESVLPKPLWSVASYLAFHSFRSLVLISLGLTILVSFGAFDWMVKLGKLVFLYGQ